MQPWGETIMAMGFLFGVGPDNQAENIGFDPVEILAFGWGPTDEIKIVQAVSVANGDRDCGRRLRVSSRGDRQ